MRLRVKQPQPMNSTFYIISATFLKFRSITGIKEERIHGAMVYKNKVKYHKYWRLY